MLKDLEKRAKYLMNHTDRTCDPRVEVYQGWTDDFSGEAGAAVNLAAALEYAAEIMKKGGLAAKYDGRAMLKEISLALKLLTAE